ncbi:MAG TPA: phytanoyl-CoA dioxygenase family protein [Planctomycetota bacterium]|nr:phytanoyl-CoA dioxygenase family protein [Planctomycetota bacterium]
MSTTTLTLKMGKREMDLGGKYLGLLRESNDILGNVAALHARIQEDGYLLIRGLHDRKKVLDARRQIMEKIAAKGGIQTGTDIMDGVISDAGKKGGFFGGVNDLTMSPAFQDLVKAKEVMGFFDRFLGGPAATFDYKWLRAVGTGESTGAHYDIVYMGRGTQKLYTCWSPLGRVKFENGPLCICTGSHNLPSFEKVRNTYGKMDVDRDHVQGWFTNDPIEVVDTYGGHWLTGEFEPGDVLVFGMYLLHGSIANTSNQYRLSCDTRYQLASEPMDERWVGAKPKAHYAWNTPGKNVTMDEARKQWGV